MDLLHLLLALGSCSFSFSAIAPLPENYHLASRFTLNLDLPPEKRWEPVLQQFNLTMLYEIGLKIMEPLSSFQYELIERLSEKYINHLTHPYISEMRGIAKVVNVPFSAVVVLNIYYDAYQVGTSIIAKDSKQDILHGRNLDVNIAPLLRNLVIVLDYTRKGKIVYTGTTYMGYVGLWTGQKPNTFTISANARDSGDWFDHALYLCDEAFPDGWLIRDVLDEEDHFLTAYMKLSTKPMLNSVYITLAGLKEGVILTRSKRNSLHNNYFKERWFLIQTNCDKFETTCQENARRLAAVDALNKKGQKKINLDNLFKVLSSEKVTDVDTVYTTLMSAASPHSYVTWIKKN